MCVNGRPLQGGNDFLDPLPPKEGEMIFDFLDPLPLKMGR
jgi:hypothetical protein